MTFQTVGEASYILQQKSPEKINAIDMEREMNKTFWPNILETIEKNKHLTCLYYIIVELQRDRMMPNVIRRKFEAPLFAKPFPKYDCSLFSFDNNSGDLTYYWTIPDEDACTYLLLNESSLKEDQMQLLSFVKKFSAGTLI